MKKSIVFGIIVLFIVVFGVYFFVRNNNGNNLISQKNKLQVDLVVAEKKLNKEKNTLQTMTNDLRSSFVLASSVQDQMKKSSNIVSQTDFMFINPEGENPELIVKNLPAVSLVNKERKDINILLIKWQNKTDILYLTKIDVNESEQIKNDTEIIQTYLKDLSNLVETLTPGNSGFSQSQIDGYLASLPSENAISEVLVSLQTAIDDSKNNNSQISNTSTENNQNQGSNIVSITPSDVVAQQGVVEEAQAQVALLQQELAQIQNKIEQLSPTPTQAPNSDTNSSSSSFNTTPGSVDTTSNPPDSNSNNNSSTPTPSPTSNSDGTDTNTQNNSVQENQNTNTSNNDNNNSTNNSYDYNVDNTNHQGIIIQPGPPQLIQGTNQY